MIRIAGYTAFFALAGLPGWAMEFANGVYLEGDAQSELIGNNSFSDTYGQGYVELGFRPKDSAFSGYVAYDLLDYEGFHYENFWGALIYKGEVASLQLGAPQPALDDYFDVPDFASIGVYDVILASGKSMLATFAYGIGSDPISGIRVDAKFGPASGGASFHQSQGLRFLEVGGRYTFGSTAISLGVERIDADGYGDVTTNYHLGAETTFANMRVGAVHSDLGNFGFELERLYLVYAPTTKLSVTGDYSFLHAGELDQNVYAVSGKYQFDNGIYGEAGYSIIDDVDDGTYTISIGAKF